MWSCHRCTYLNHEDLLVCELCEASRGNASSSSSSSSSKSSSRVTKTTKPSKETRKKGRPIEEFKKGTMVAFKGGADHRSDDVIWLGKIAIYDRKSFTSTEKKCFVQVFDQISPTVFTKSGNNDLVLIDLMKVNDLDESVCLPVPDAFIRYDGASKCYTANNALSTLFDGTTSSKSSVEVRKLLAKVDDDYTSNIKRGTFKHVLLGGNLGLGLTPKNDDEEEEEAERERQEKNDVGIYDKKTKRIRFNNFSKSVAPDDEVSKFISHENYIGVYSIHAGDQRDRAFKAMYRKNNKQLLVPGIFQSSVEAARAYDEFVICYVSKNNKLFESEESYFQCPPLNFNYDTEVELSLLFTVVDDQDRDKSLKRGQEGKRKDGTMLDIQDQASFKKSKLNTSHHDMHDNDIEVIEISEGEGDILVNNVDISEKDYGQIHDGGDSLSEATLVNSIHNDVAAYSGDRKAVAEECTNYATTTITTTVSRAKGLSASAYNAISLFMRTK